MNRKWGVERHGCGRRFNKQSRKNWADSFRRWIGRHWHRVFLLRAVCSHGRAALAGMGSGHIFWTYFAGVALIASGLGMIFRVKAQLATTLLGAMLFRWILVIHIPRALADPYRQIGNECTSAFEALAQSRVAFILGETLGRERRKTDRARELRTNVDSVDAEQRQA